MSHILSVSPIFKNRHGPLLHIYDHYTPTCSYRPKVNETVWNVLQNEDEHRLLDGADTKCDALITHIWALNNFAALFSSIVGVADWAPCVGVDTMWRHTQGSKKINEIPAVSSEISFDGRSWIFLESIIIDLHFASDSLCLSSFKFFWWAPQDFSISKRGTFLPFKVIQGRWIWQLALYRKHMWLPISS